jgi:hypothetical protein
MTDKDRTTDEILLELVESMESPLASNLDGKWERKVFEDVRGSDNLLEWCRETMAMDMKRYFSAVDDESRAQIKGAFSRTAYIRGLLVKMGNVKKVKKDVSGKRKKLT